VNNFQSTRTDYQCNSNAWDVSKGAEHWVGSGTYDPELPLSLLVPTTGNISSMLSGVDFGVLQNAALAKLDSGWDALTFLAEFKEAFSMVLKDLQLIANILASFRRYKESILRAIEKWELSTKAGKALVDSWLEARFGWRPLINDMKAISDLLTGAESKYLRARCRVHLLPSVSRPYTFSDAVSHTGTFTTEYTADLVAAAGAITNCAMPSIKVDPLLTVWELIPFSFVVDWFINVGVTLSALHTLSVLPNVVAYHSYVLDVAATGSITSYTNLNGWVGTRSVSHSGRFLYKFRVGVPAEVQPITFNWRLDLGKVLDLIALIRQRL